MLKSLIAELQPRRLLPNLTAGLIVGLLEVIVSISFAALIFGAELADFLSNGVGLALFGSIIICVLIALFSSYPGSVGGIQDVPAAIFAVSVGSIVTMMPTGAQPQETFITAVVALALATILTGILFLLLARFRLADLMRYLPYPVVGGFLAGTGWVLVTGALELMTGTDLRVESLYQYFTPDTLAHWLPGLGFSLILLLLAKRFDHYLLLPGTIVVGSALFFAVMSAAGLSISELSAQGWFIGPFPEQSLWSPLSPRDLAQANWAVIGGQAVNLLTVVFVSAIALLLNISAVEISVNKDVDFNHELRVTGFSNIVAGLSSGMVGYHQISLSILGEKLGTASRLVAIIAAIICVLTLFWGASLLAFFPKVVVGGLLLYLGLALLEEWLMQTWWQFSRLDYAIVLLILLAVISLGFLEGVALGIVAAVLKFALSYSQTEAVRHELSGDNYQSRVTRSPEEQHTLSEFGQRIHIAQLQGFIFFGTADKLLKRLRNRFEANETKPVRFIILDFRRVTGLDSTALLSFRKLKQVAQAEDTALVLTEVSPGIRNQLLGSSPQAADNQLRFFPDLDQGVEWCENQLLEKYGAQQAHLSTPLDQQLTRLIPEGFEFSKLINHLEKRIVEQGERIVRQGDEPEFLFFIESGQVSALLERPDNTPLRLETMRSGRIVGEIGFYLGQERTATIVADEPSVIYRLSRHNFLQLEKENPEVAAILHRIAAHLLAERVTHLVTAINALRE